MRAAILGLLFFSVGVRTSSGRASKYFPQISQIECTQIYADFIRLTLICVHLRVLDKRDLREKRPPEVQFDFRKIPI